MDTVSADAIRREPVPPEVMIEVEQPFHADPGYFFGLDRRVYQRETHLPPVGITPHERLIASHILENPSVVWVSFSERAIEFGINASFEQAFEMIKVAFWTLKEEGFQPKSDGITFRS